MSFDATQHHVWLGQNYEGIQVINPTDKKVITSVQLTSAAIFDIQFLGDNAFIALSDGIVLVMDKNRVAVKKHLKASSQSARCIAINAKTREIAVGYSDNLIRVFDADTFELRHTLAAHTNSVFTVQYSPDGQFLLSGSRDAHLHVWEVSSQYQLYKDIVAHLFAINHLVFSPDASMFASCSMDKSIKIWDAISFRLLKVIDRARHAGHGTSVNKLLWTNFNNLLVSASDDKRLSVWDIKSS